MADEQSSVSESALMEGFNIKRARELAGLTQEALADAVGLSISQISRFESGERIPRVDELERIAAPVNSQNGAPIN